MTTCIYCEKDRNEYGSYEPYDCSKTRNKDYEEALDICDRCPYYIPEGEEVPA